MGSPLNRLEGMTLAAVDGAGESLTLVFDGCTLNTFNPCRTSVALKGLVGARVEAVSMVPGSALHIRFAGGSELAVSLADADYKGPEAFAIKFKDGLFVVE